MKVLGRGTFGSVHLVYRKDDKKQKRMAMKTIKKELVEIIHFFGQIKNKNWTVIERTVCIHLISTL